jgi:predicted aconitase with swiveling domain
VAGGRAFFDLLHKGIAPKAFIFGKLNPGMVQGAVLARMPVAEGWDRNLFDLVRSGDVARLDPREELTILE